MRARSRAAALGAALAAVALAAACAAPRAPAGPEPAPTEVFAALLARNPGLSSLRAEVEARFSYAAGEVTLPGVLLLDSLGGFRLDLLDPLDRPLAIVYGEEGRIVQYRPSQGLAASLALFPEECGGVGPADWVAAVLSSGRGPLPGERLALSAHWRGERSLERRSEGRLRQSVRFRQEGAELVPRLVSWYCGDEPVLQLRFEGWEAAGEWRLPKRLTVEYPAAGLTVDLELRAPEGNPLLEVQALRPRLAEGTRWTRWRLPQ